MDTVQQADVDQEFAAMVTSAWTPPPPEIVPRQSLWPLRIVALVGAALSILVVVLGFRAHTGVGLAALIAAPALPLTLVLAADRLRR